MREHYEEIISPYTPEQLYKLVANVEDYPNFIPWCVAVRVQERHENYIIADLVIGFKGINECYTSKVKFLDNEIDIEYIKGPFSDLHNNWKFTKLENNDIRGTKINFLIKFKFKSKLLEAVIGSFFDVACQKMVGAFQKRAEELYGKN